MNTIKKILGLLLTLIILIGVCGCMNTTKNNSNRKESDSEYAELMKNYMEEKYGRSFEIVNCIFPQMNTGSEMNVAILQDSEGIQCDVRAKIGTPYDYFDYYIESYTAAKLAVSLDNDISQIGEMRFFLTVDNEDIKNIDYSKDNVSSVTLVGKVEHFPQDEDFKSLYNIYGELIERGYTDIDILIGFVKQSEEFDLAVQNYRVYGKSKWEYYSGDFYGYLTVKSAGLSLEEFKSCFETSRK